METEHWSRETVVREISRLQEEGEDLRHSIMSANQQRLVSAAVRYYGSWGAAVTAAGIDYAAIRKQSQEARSAKVTKWSMDTIGAKIRTLVDAGESLSAANVRQNHPALFSAAVSPRYYGSWRDALTSQGLNYDEILTTQRSCSKAPRDARGTRIVMRRMQVLGEMAKELSAEQAKARYPRLYEKAANHFESWDAAVEAAFKPRERPDNRF